MSSNLRKIAKKFIFIRKKHFFVLFLDKIIFLCFCYINSHIWVLWWRHTFIHVQFIAFLCVCVCVVFVGVFLCVVCACSVYVWHEFFYICALLVFLCHFCESVRTVRRMCSPQACAACARCAHMTCFYACVVCVLVKISSCKRLFMCFCVFVCVYHSF